MRESGGNVCRAERLIVWLGRGSELRSWCIVFAFVCGVTVATLVPVAIARSTWTPITDLLVALPLSVLGLVLARGFVGWMVR